MTRVEELDPFDLIHCLAQVVPPSHGKFPCFGGGYYSLALGRAVHMVDVRVRDESEVSPDLTGRVQDEPGPACVDLYSSV